MKWFILFYTVLELQCEKKATLLRWNSLLRHMFEQVSHISVRFCSCIQWHHITKKGQRSHSDNEVQIGPRTKHLFQRTTSKNKAIVHSTWAANIEIDEFVGCVCHCKQNGTVPSLVVIEVSWISSFWTTRDMTSINGTNTKWIIPNTSEIFWDFQKFLISAGPMNFPVSTTGIENV